MKSTQRTAVNSKRESFPAPADLHRESIAESMVMELMAIRGPSGEEAEVAGFIQEKLLASGAKPNQVSTDSAHRRALIRGDTGNLILKLPGTVRAPRRMLTAHMDTVPICLGSKPKKKGKFIHSSLPGVGIGADDRAGVAVLLNTALLLLEHKLPHPPLTFCWFIQEEIGLHGARCVTKSALGNPALTFNWDGGSPAKVTVGATGGYRMQIKVSGVASHAGNAPEDGVSAIAIAALAIADLQGNGWHGAIEKNGKLGTSNVGVIQGGNATNVVTDQVLLRAEARSHDSKFRERIVREFEKAFTKAAKQLRNRAGEAGSVEIEGRLDYDSFRLNQSDPTVVSASHALESLGATPQLAIANGGVDANWLNLHGFPTVTLGCGQMNPHMATEGLDLNEFHLACRLAMLLATGNERESDQ